MPTPCVNPETALFPEIDLWWLDLFVSRGIDMPCEYYGGLMGLAIAGAVALAMGATLLVWYVWTYRARHAHHSAKSTRYEISRLRRRNQIEAARNLYAPVTRGKYFYWTH